MKKRNLYMITAAILINVCAYNVIHAEPKEPCVTTVLNEGADGPSHDATWIYCEGEGSEFCKGTIKGNNTWGVSCTIGHQPYQTEKSPTACKPESTLKMKNCP